MAKNPAPSEVLRRAVQKAGGQTKFAEICECTQGNIWQLLQKGSPLPAQYVLRVEAALDISRHELRPDLYPVEPARAA